MVEPALRVRAGRRRVLDGQLDDAEQAEPGPGRADPGPDGSGHRGALAVDRDRMADATADGYTTATTLADALVRRGVPFRAAHHVVGGLVAQAERDGIRVLSDVPAATFAGILAAADDEIAHGLAADPDVVAALLAGATIAGSLAAADVIGGTAPARVSAAIAAARARMDREDRP